MVITFNKLNNIAENKVLLERLPTLECVNLSDIQSSTPFKGHLGGLCTVYYICI